MKRAISYLVLVSLIALTACKSHDERKSSFIKHDLPIGLYTVESITDTGKWKIVTLKTGALIISPKTASIDVYLSPIEFEQLDLRVGDYGWLNGAFTRDSNERSTAR